MRKIDDRQGFSYALHATFNLDELKNICSDLEVNDQDFPPNSGKQSFIREFLDYVKRKIMDEKLIDWINKSTSHGPFYSHLDEFESKEQGSKEIHSIKKAIIVLKEADLKDSLIRWHVEEILTVGIVRDVTEELMEEARAHDIADMMLEEMKIEEYELRSSE